MTNPALRFVATAVLLGLAPLHLQAQTLPLVVPDWALPNSPTRKTNTGVATNVVFENSAGIVR